MNGLYCDRLRLIVLHDRLNDRQRRCTLQHELIHAVRHDAGCGTLAGIRAEKRTRRQTAATLIDPLEYATAEAAYDGDTYLMSVELGVTTQVLEDYRAYLAGRIETATPARERRNQ